MSVSPTYRGANTTFEFESLLATIAAPLRRALLASYGPVVAGDIYADTVAWAWEHQDRLAKMTNRLRDRRLISWSVGGRRGCSSSRRASRGW